jgi:histidinol-phosphate aminotransferase
MQIPFTCGVAVLKPRTAVQTLPAYHPPLGGRVGLRCDFNENTVGCSPRVLAKLRSLSPEDLARYPEREPIEAVIAEHLRLQPAEVLLTNGVDEAIHLLCETFLEPDDEVLIPVPTFAMYEIFAATTGASILKISCDNDFCFPIDRLLLQVSARTKLIAIANPNNPTGAVADPEDILALAEAAPHAAILIDEAYFDFYGTTLFNSWNNYPNLFVARTFSKAYGLAGLRAGFLTGAPEALASVRRVASPYSVNSVALACLPEAVADKRFVENYASEVCAQRERLQMQLTIWGIRFWPSQANFVLFHVGEKHAQFVAAMRARGILVRDRSRDPGCDGCVRATLGLRTQTDLLIAAMAEVFAELKLISPERSQ